jgi:hypothetical protein
MYACSVYLGNTQKEKFYYKLARDIEKNIFFMIFDYMTEIN